MARPRKWRSVCCLPESNIFGPLNYNGDIETIIMTVEEYETIRLIDYEDLNQEECSERMNVARTTVQKIYSDARKKLAQSLVNGNLLKIEGGDYRFYDDTQRKFECRRCRRHRFGQNFMENRKDFRRNIMKVAIPVNENNKDTEVCISFGRAPYFLVYDIDTKTEEFIENTATKSQGGAGIKAAQIVADSKVDALITPRCGENAAQVLETANIKIYKSKNNSVKDNIEALVKGELAPLEEIHEGLHNHGGK